MTNMTKRMVEMIMDPNGHRIKRLMVPGGWLVKIEHTNFYTRGAGEAFVSESGQNWTFIADAEHEWEIEKRGDEVKVS